MMKNIIVLKKEISDDLESDGTIVIKKSDLRKLFNIKKRSSNVPYKEYYVRVIQGLRNLHNYCDCGNHLELHKYYTCEEMKIK